MLEKVTGQSASLFGFRVSTPDSSPGKVEWLDVEVHPFISSPEKYYSINLVWRSKERDPIIDATKRLSEILTEFVNGLEAAIA